MTTKATDLQTVDEPKNEVQTMQSAILEIVKRTDIDPDRLERFLDLQIKMEDRQAEKELSVALANFQASCPPISKTRQGHNSKYSPLDEIVTIIKDTLNNAGLSCSFSTSPHDEKYSKLDTTIRHKSGASVVSTYFYPRTDESGNKNAAQGVKSALTYAKRAGLENALGIVTKDEDTDANTKKELVADNSKVDEIKKLLKETKSDEKKFFKYVGVESFDEMTEFHAEKALHVLKEKRRS